MHGALRKQIDEAARYMRRDSLWTLIQRRVPHSGILHGVLGVVGQVQQHVLLPMIADELQPDRHAAVVGVVPHRYCDRRQPCTERQ